MIWWQTYFTSKIFEIIQVITSQAPVMTTIVLEKNGETVQTITGNLINNRWSNFKKIY
jgi:hypothetical protein